MKFKDIAQSLFIRVNFTTFLIIVFVYSCLYLFPTNDPRELSSFAGSIFNGHLGVLFRFRLFPLVTAFVIPLLIFRFFKRKIELANLIFGSLFLMAFLLIAIRGYYNYRYQLTLIPSILIFIYIFQSKYSTSERSFFNLLIVFSIIIPFGFPLKKNISSSPKGYFSEIISTQEQNKLKIERPKSLIDDLKSKGIDDVLVFNVPQLFLYLDSKNIHSYFTVQKYLTEGKTTSFKDYIILNKIKWIYIKNSLFKSNLLSEKIIGINEVISILSQSELVATDSNTSLFKLSL